MTRKILQILLFSYSVIAFGQGPKAPPAKPQLIVAIVVDQFRYDYLLRFRKDYTGGFKTLLEQGAVFDDAHHIHYPTVTAVGHSTFMSGATPSISGIVNNEWYDRAAQKNVTSVSDDDTMLVGGVPGAPGSSPRKLLVSTVGDEIKMAGQPAKVIGISIKDRGAILTSGHMADAAYWFDADSNRWTTSSYYMQETPGWVKEINQSRPQARAIGEQWLPLGAKPGDKALCTMVAGVADTRYCGSIEASPWGNELIEEFAEKAIAMEKMGQHTGATDVLTVSFSSNDYVGHAVGPDAPEIRDLSMRTDLLLGKLIAVARQSAGADNVVFVLTADHGVSPVPEVNTGRKMPGGRLSDTQVMSTVQQALTAKYGQGKWVIGNTGTTPYLDRSLVEKYKTSLADVEGTAAEAVRAMPHVFRVYTSEDIRAGRVTRDEISAAITYGFYGARSGDIFVITEPYYLYDATGTSHGTPFNYDSHVPLIFLGAGLHAGHYFQKTAINDVAPTLAAIAGVETPSGSVGRVLQEMWQ